MARLSWPGAGYIPRWLGLPIYIWSSVPVLTRTDGISFIESSALPDQQTCLTASFPGHMGKLAPERLN